jgi:ubiquinone/menaquinone biosynthesis C-methylase UbiE
MGLPIVEEKQKTKRQLYEEEVQQSFKNLSLDKIDPYRTIQGRLRIERTVQLLEKNVPILGSTIADLGCGSALIASLLADLGGEITAVDAAPQFLNCSKDSRIARVKASIPYLPFADSTFDGVVFTDVIAEIEPHLYRLTLSELSRILKRGGWLICSTELDLHSYDAQDRFIELVKSEFEILASQKSYHRLHLYLMRWLKAPFRFIRAGKEKEYRLTLLQKREGLMRFWFYLNSIQGISSLWQPIAFLLRPLSHSLQKNRRFLLFCERFSLLFWGRRAPTHLIVLARKKKM